MKPADWSIERIGSRFKLAEDIVGETPGLYRKFFMIRTDGAKLHKGDKIAPVGTNHEGETLIVMNTGETYFNVLIYEENPNVYWAPWHGKKGTEFEIIGGTFT